MRFKDMAQSSSLVMFTRMAFTVLLALGFFYCSGPTTSDRSQKEFFSSQTSGHSHTVILYREDVQNGWTITHSTFYENEHNHFVTVDYGSIKAGSTVTAQTTESQSHTHSFTFSKWY